MSSILEDDRLWSASFCTHLQVPRWKAPDSASTCGLCEDKFSFRRKRHNCRLCGQVVCSACTSKRSVPVMFRLKNKTGKVRVCNKCKMEVRAEWQLKQISAHEQHDEAQQAWALGKGDNVIFEAARAFPVPVWKDPRDVQQCAQCDKAFKSKHKHTCRLCGDVFCNSCTKKRNVPAVFRLKGKTGPTRVCMPCELRAKRNVIDFNNANNAASRRDGSSSGLLTEKQMKALLKGKKFAPMVTVDEGEDIVTSTGFSLSRSMTRTKMAQTHDSMENIRALVKRCNHLSIPVWAEVTEYENCHNCKASGRLGRKRDWCRLCGEMYCKRCLGLFFLPPRYTMTMPQDNKNTGHTPVPVCHGDFFKIIYPDRKVSADIMLPQWKSVASFKECVKCRRNKSRAHNCRLCGDLFCSDCTSKMEIPEPFKRKAKRGPARVCDLCRFRVFKGARLLPRRVISANKRVGLVGDASGEHRHGHQTTLEENEYAVERLLHLEPKQAETKPTNSKKSGKKQIKVLKNNLADSLAAELKQSKDVPRAASLDSKAEPESQPGDTAADRSNKQAAKFMSKLKASACSVCEVSFGLWSKRYKCNHCPKFFCARCMKDHPLQIALESAGMVSSTRRGNSKRPSFGRPKTAPVRTLRSASQRQLDVLNCGDGKHMQLIEAEDRAESPVPGPDAVSSVADTKQLEPPSPSPHWDTMVSSQRNDNDNHSGEDGALPHRASRAPTVRINHNRDGDSALPHRASQAPTVRIDRNRDDGVGDHPPPRARLSRLAGSKIVVKRNSVLVAGQPVKLRRSTIMIGGSSKRGSKQGVNLLAGIKQPSRQSMLSGETLLTDEKKDLSDSSCEPESDSESESSDGEPPPLPTSAPPPIPISALPPIPQNADTSSEEDGHEEWSSEDSSSDEDNGSLSLPDSRRATQVLADAPEDADVEEYEEEVEVIDESVTAEEYRKATLIADYRTLKVLPSSDMLSHSSHATLDENDPSTLFEFGERLGEGSYGAVYLATDLRDDKQVAVKVLNVESEDELRSLRDECLFMEHCDSPYVVSLRGQWYYEKQLYIAMEYCEAGSLSDVMEICEITFDESQIAVIMRETLLGLDYLHKNQKLHRDVKSGNILLSLQGECKLADFGVSVELQTADEKRKTMIGTPYWMAPEVLQSAPYDSKADIWSLGITALELVKGAPPNCDIHPMRAIFAIPREPAPRLPDPENWSTEFISFIECTIQKDPAKRWSAERLLKEHPFLVSAGTLEELQQLAEVSLPEIVAFRLEDSNEEEDEEEEVGTTLINRSKLDDEEDEDDGAYDSSTFVAGGSAGTMEFTEQDVSDAEVAEAQAAPMRFSQVLMKYKKRDSVVYQYNAATGGIVANGEMLADQQQQQQTYRSASVVDDPITEGEEEEERDESSDSDFMDLT
jgi:serine/threonine protein kinase